MTSYSSGDCTEHSGGLHDSLQEVAKKQLSEGTIGYNNLEHAELFKKLFGSEYYLCSAVKDVVGAEMAGTLKNVVALGAGFVDGLGGGANPKVHPVSVSRMDAVKSVETTDRQSFCGQAFRLKALHQGSLRVGPCRLRNDIPNTAVEISVALVLCIRQTQAKFGNLAHHLSLGRSSHNTNPYL